MKKTLIVLCLLLMAVAVTASAASFGIKISGPGAVNDSTIKAGTKVSFDIYSASKDSLKAFSLGFKYFSPDIEMVTHVSDSSKGLNKEGDVKGWNGWGDKSVWDFGGVWPALKDWDGKLPDTIGFAGLVVRKVCTPHESTKVLSFEVVVPSAGTIMVDTTWYPPGGSWKVVTMDKKDAYPVWKGPYKWKVVK